MGNLISRARPSSNNGDDNSSENTTFNRSRRRSNEQNEAERNFGGAGYNLRRTRARLDRNETTSVFSASSSTVNSANNGSERPTTSVLRRRRTPENNHASSNLGSPENNTVFSVVNSASAENYPPAQTENPVRDAQQPTTPAINTPELLQTQPRFTIFFRYRPRRQTNAQNQTEDGNQAPGGFADRLQPVSNASLVPDNESVVVVEVRLGQSNQASASSTQADPNDSSQPQPHGSASAAPTTEQAAQRPLENTATIHMSIFFVVPRASLAPAAPQTNSASQTTPEAQPSSQETPMPAAEVVPFWPDANDMQEVFIRSMQIVRQLMASENASTPGIRIFTTPANAGTTTGDPGFDAAISAMIVALAERMQASAAASHQSAGLTPQELAKLDECSQVIEEEPGSSERCPICLDLLIAADTAESNRTSGNNEAVLRTANLRRLTCNHVFHRECADLWLSRHNSCPLCRKAAVQRADPSPPTPPDDPSAVPPNS